MGYRDYIVRDRQICGGAPVIKGTRILLRTILASLAEGATDQETLADFPTLTEEALRAVVQLAAARNQSEEGCPV
jgi:uncharacterized protein (DUF433 family)